MPRPREAVLLTIGEAFEDLVFAGLPHLPGVGEEVRTDRFTATIGGGAVITATAAARLGMRTTVISGLSALAVRRLRREKIRIVNVKRRGEPDAVTACISTRRDRTFVTFSGMNDRLEARLPAALARERAAHVHFAFPPADGCRWARIVERLRARGATTSWDFGWNPELRRVRGFDALLGSVDYLFVNDAEARLYATDRRGDSMAAYWRSRVRNTIVRSGAKGSRWITAELDVSATAPRVRAVDTTGAGDAFNGGFLFALLAGRSPIDCLRMGNVVGAQSTRGIGGIDALPTRRARRR